MKSHPRSFLLLMIFILSVASPPAALAAGNWISFGGESGEETLINVLESNELKTVVEVIFPGMHVLEHHQEGVTFQELRISKCGSMTEVGRPKLPVLSRLIAVPADREVSISVLDEERVSLEGYRMVPYQTPPLRSGERVQDFVVDTEFYRTASIFPVDPVVMEEPAVIRDFRVVPVNVYPARVHPATGTVTITKRITLELTYSDGETVNVKTRDVDGYTPTWEPLYRAHIANFDTAKPLTRSSPGLYLIISHDTFYGTMLPFTTWKEMKGIPVLHTRRSEIGPNPTWLDIYNYIRDIYDNSPIPLENVLLVGDHDFIPVHYGIYSTPNDHEYSTLEGNDYLPDVAIGRFSVRTTAELQVVVDKSLKYETDPNLGESDWFTEGTTMSGSDYVDDRNADTCRNVLLDHGYTQVDRFFTSLGTNSQPNISNALNDGRTWVVYFGHGWSGGWSSPSPSFDSGDVRNLVNYNKLSVITSIACSNGALDGGSDCFAEVWQKEGDIDAGTGSAGIFAASRDCPFFYTDTLGIGVTRGFFELNLHTFGTACAYGKLYMYEYFPQGPGSTTEEVMQQFLLFGEPELNVWTGVPVALTVTHPDAVVLGQIPVTVTVRRGGSLLRNALVCLSKGEEVWESGYTDAQGEVTLIIETLSPGLMDIIVTGYNGIPYAGTIEVITPEGPWILLDDYAIEDSAGGNGNGEIDYGEAIDFTTAAKNVGVEDGVDVTGLLETADPYITISDAQESFGTIAPGEIGWCLEDFDFSVDAACPDEHLATFTLTFTDENDSTWTSEFSLGVHAPDLGSSSILVDDSTGGNGDGKIDPGETADLYVTVGNDGTGEANDVTGDIAASDPYVTIHTASAPYPDILPGGEAENTTPYTVEIDAGCPDGHRIDFDITIGARNGYSVDDGFTITVGGFSDDMESGQGEWTHYIVTGGYKDEWHLSNQRNHTPGGTYSWKCGSTGSGDYSDLDDSGLQTPLLFLGSNSTLSFYHWMDAEIDNGEWAWDGGIVEISTNGGASWTQITPDGGYPYKITSNPDSPFQAGTPCFSGTHNWIEETFDLSAYSGEASIRFRFGSDGYITQEGWYIDDVLIFSDMPDITITASDTPSSVAPGEVATWRLDATNGESYGVIVDIWMTVESEALPGPLDFILMTDINLPGGFSGGKQVQRPVPLGTPAGSYDVHNKIGRYPGTVYSVDTFTTEITE